MRTVDLNPFHPVGVVGILLHSFLAHGFPEARPAGPGIELGLGAEEFTAAHDAMVDTLLMAVPVFAAEGSFSPLVDAHLILLWGKTLLQLSFLFFEHEKSC